MSFDRAGKEASTDSASCKYLSAGGYRVQELRVQRMSCHRLLQCGRIGRSSAAICTVTFLHNVLHLWDSGTVVQAPRGPTAGMPTREIYRRFNASARDAAPLAAF